jgi:hypothetical protein
MSAWYLLWMFFTALGIIVLGLAVPFAWGYAAEYSAAARARRKRLFWMAVASRSRTAGLPCTTESWAHLALEPVPGVGLMCRRCGWGVKAHSS